MAKKKASKTKSTKKAPAPAKKKVVDASRLMIPDLKVVQFIATIEGTTPLIVHRFSEKMQKQMAEKQQGKASKGREFRTPESEYEEAKYIDKAGRDCITADSFKNAIVRAASEVPGLTMVGMRGSVFILSPEGERLVPLKYSGKKPIMREDIVRLANGVATPRYRPEYRNWSCDVLVEIDANVLSAEQVCSLINISGFRVGIGEWRPTGKASTGTFGRYKIAQVKQI